MRYRKDIAWPGRYRLPDGKWIQFSRNDTAFLHQRAREMLDAGLQIPVSWEHQDDAQPLTTAEAKANTAKFNLGFIADSSVGPDGILESIVDVPVASDAERLEAVPFVSPEIRYNWTDGLGKLWPGPSITHVAVTPRPVNHQQKRFEKVSLSQYAATEPIRLSLADYEGDMADDVDDTVMSDVPADDAASAEVPGGDLQEVLSLLAEQGLVLDPSTTAENFIDHLKTALHTKKAHVGAMDPDKDGDNDTSSVTDTDNDQGNGNIVEESSPVMMSMQSRLADLERDGLKRRIRDLLQSGRITPPLHKSLLNDLGTVRMSFDAKAHLKPTTLSVRVDAYEALPESHAFPVQMSRHVEEVEHPDQANDLGDDASILAEINKTLRG